LASDTVLRVVTHNTIKMLEKIGGAREDGRFAYPHLRVLRMNAISPMITSTVGHV
jgi:hypothetical protein